MIEFKCNCAMGSHRAPLEGFEVSSGAINKIPEILKDGVTGFVIDDFNPAKYADAIAKIIDIPSVRLSMAKEIKRDSCRFAYKRQANDFCRDCRTGR